MPFKDPQKAKEFYAKRRQDKEYQKLQKKSQIKFKLNNPNYFLEYSSEYQRKDLEKRSLYCKQYHKNYYKDNKYKIYAQLAVNKAIKNGTILKPTQCIECGRTTKLHAHHEDYLKQLEVIFLCCSCHKRLHYLKKRLLTNITDYV